MYFLLLMLFACLPKVKDLESSGSMCMDALQVNLIKEECYSLKNEQDELGVKISCMSSSPDSVWSKKIFYITALQIDLENIGGFYPICMDRDIIVYVIQ